MQEKTMVADTLAGINGELTRYAGMIAQSENKELKQTLKQFAPPVSSPRRSCIRLPERNLIMCRQRKQLRKRWHM